ncbi:hypothetical protein [Parabacteroides faecis]|uniref:hypothetical protein n=2 Tax=Parabacteroides faecis TaxID=1217282 RepID=UPI0021660A78|nr:hypothetical protein [Parabacteroides faecis]MCS2894406.1 hypothetical protein [Parabacteroides faecis]
MTKEEWKKIEDWWGTGYSSIKMKVDGHDIQLDNCIDKKKMIVEVAIYVDGYIRGEYSTAGNEIGDRFWNRIKKTLYTPKQLKERAKLWGKRSKEAQQKYFEYNTPSWRSFSAFKKHITSHNKEISLVTTNTFNADGSEA